MVLISGILEHCPEELNIFMKEHQRVCEMYICIIKRNTTCISPISRYRKHIFLLCMVLGQPYVMNSENQTSPQQLGQFFCPETKTVLESYTWCYGIIAVEW